MGSDIEIRVAGTDVSRSVMFRTARFESQQNAQPGTFEITLKDPDRTLGPFVTGSEVTLDVDGVRHFGGYVTQVSRKFAFPVDILPADSRLWVLRGVDYNILFDKRVLRNPANYLRSIPFFRGNQYDGDLISFMCATYLDLPAGFDSTTHVDNVALALALAAPDATRVGGWKQQGTPWREQMEMFRAWSGGVYYIDPELALHYHALEETLAPVDFSDDPNGTTTFGMRDVVAVEIGGSNMTNDALVWGGSEWVEDVVFARAQSASSQTTHGRWQEAEHHFGEDAYKLTTQWRADQIVFGSPAVPAGFNPGRSQPQWNLNFTWYAKDLPGVQVRAGQLVTTYLTTMGAPLNPIQLPLRSVSISFPNVSEDGTGDVQFDGSAGLSLNDPFSLWGYLRAAQQRGSTSVVAAASDTTTATTYGSFGQFTPVQLSGLVYDLPNEIGYIAGTAQLYDNGVLLRRDIDFTESDPVAGEITLTSSPSGWLWLVCRTT